ncbi:MAG: beta-N-acetylhexosaminidase [Burkholderiales bacterium]|nr:beta-N-acetylhexosaminidase [Burkholderiales bacterium]
MIAAGPPQGDRPPVGGGRAAPSGGVSSSKIALPRGPVVLGVEGCALTVRDRERLQHPLVGGVILFARNFRDCATLAALTLEIRDLRSPALLVCVDHEGGRVQRFRDGFTAIAPMRELGSLWERDAAAAAAEARRLGAVVGRELRAHGVDFSFTPVLDLDFGSSTVIGDRAFSGNPDAVAQLASALRAGLNAAGCAAVGKHFPGHGFVVADSHLEVPVDERSYAELAARDLVPFAALVKAGLEAVMPAHVVYPAVDAVPAGYSRVWLQEILRGRLVFDGLIFSDDLGMAGACTAGDIVARADAALIAGCDMVLSCNDFPAVDDLLSRWRPVAQPDLARRAARMEGR